VKGATRGRTVFVRYRRSPLLKNVPGVMVSKTIKCSQVLLLLFFTEALIPQFPRARGPFKTSIRTLSTLLASSLDMPPLVIETPANDFTTEYYQFVLPNGIPTTIVRVNAAEKSSCSLAVKAGAQDDPTDRQGLAHFTEHAVFLGSVKFPEERAYKEFLSKNGGSSNAGTGMESTVYKFEVNSKSFPHSLDLFSQFFKQPLFTEDAIAREVMAVDAEDSKNRIIDGMFAENITVLLYNRIQLYYLEVLHSIITAVISVIFITYHTLGRRILQVVKDLMLPDHPYAKFSTGNVKTLASGDAEKNKYEVTKAMRAFHVKHYKPENMVRSLLSFLSFLSI
jgi:insulysin